MIQLLTFDLDNTLWDTPPVILHAEQQLKAWMQAHLPEAVAQLEADQIRATFRDIRSRHPQITHHPTHLRKKILETIFERCGLSPGAEIEQHTEAAFDVFYRARNTITLFHHAEAVLKSLSRRYPLIALTNGNANLAMIGIDHYFQAHFSAETEGLPKPHSAMFQRALQHAGCEARAAIHIGDHPLEDIEAAREMGFHTVWFNQDSRQPDDICTPTETISQIEALPAAVDRIARAVNQADRTRQ